MELTAEQVRVALEKESDWIFAKSMPQWPHHYTLRHSWRASCDFEDVVRYIDYHGYRERFLPTGKLTTCFDIGVMKYWTMGGPLAKIGVINRAKSGGPLVERV